MTDARDLARDRAAIADAVVRRVGGDRDAVGQMVDEIAGGFSPAFYRAAVALLPPAIGRAFGDRFASRVVVEGSLDRLRELATRATLIVAPTHASNLDSIVLGLVLGRSGLPPLAYAAGKHIYRHRLFALAMRRLGAFRLDPDRHDRLYLRVVQAYVNELVARGYHTVIFPGGTRCRTGAVESQLKLGLLGAAVHVARPIAIVPVSINYQIVLEAEWLIGYHLAGRATERIVGDELFVWGRLRDTARRLAALDQRVVIRIGDPIDPRATAGSWRPHVADALAAAYRRDTVYFATHVVSRALHDLGGDPQPVARVHAAVADAHARLAADPALGRPWHGLDSALPSELVEAALAAWASWHRTPPAVRRGPAIEVAARDLILFYRNRSAHVP